LLDEVTLRLDGLFLDAVLEMIMNFVDVFKDNKKPPSEKTIAECLYNDTKEAKVTTFLFL